MKDSKNPSPSDDKKVAESTSTTNSQSDNKQSDKDKSYPPYKKQDDKVAEGAAAAYTPSIKKQPDNHLSIPDSEKKHYATKEDLLNANNVIIDRMDKIQSENRGEFKDIREKVNDSNKSQIILFARLQNMILIAIILFLLNLTGLPEYLLRLISQFF